MNSVHRGTIPSPNIWSRPEVYEVENQAVDRAGLIERTIGELHPYAGARLLDIGCGTGFHLGRFAARGAAVVGIEPHPPLVALARKRIQDNGIAASVLCAGADSLPLADNSIDIVQARWAYFFGAGSEPGVSQARRVLRPGGVVAIIDNDPTRSTFGDWFTRTHPAYDPLAVQRFWRRAGFERTSLDIAWECDSRADFEAIVRIEFAPADADRILAEHAGTAVDYAINLWWWRKP